MGDSRAELREDQAGVPRGGEPCADIPCPVGGGPLPGDPEVQVTEGPPACTVSGGPVPGGCEGSGGSRNWPRCPGDTWFDGLEPRGLPLASEQVGGQGAGTSVRGAQA